MGERGLGANLARERESDYGIERDGEREREKGRQRRKYVVENPKGKSMGVKESGKGLGGSSLA